MKHPSCREGILPPMKGAVLGRVLMLGYLSVGNFAWLGLDDAYLHCERCYIVLTWL